jgi:hypothetical protein
VEITLVTGKDRPVPTGSLNVLYYLGGNAVKNQSYLVQKSISLVNGKAIAQFPVPNELTPNPDGLVGYWFKEQSFDLSAGKNPLDQKIEVMPAGVIHGRVTAEVDLRDKLFTYSTLLIQAPPELKRMLSLDPNDVPRQGSDHYLTTPLPFGGVYSVLLQQGASTYTVSPPIAIDAAHPVVTCDLHQVADSVIRGKFMDPDNGPIGLESVSLIYHPTSLCSFSNVAARTARDGSFTIPNVNLKVPGYYEIQLDSVHWTQNDFHIKGSAWAPFKLTAQRK